MVILGIPLTVNVLAVWHWRGRYGRLPVIVLVVLGLAFVVDVVGAMQGGNLTGIWSIIAGPPAMLLLIVRAVAQRPPTAWSGTKTSQAPMVSGANSPFMLGT